MSIYLYIIFKLKKVSQTLTNIRILMCKVRWIWIAYKKRRIKTLFIQYVCKLELNMSKIKYKPQKKLIRIRFTHPHWNVKLSIVRFPLVFFIMKLHYIRTLKTLYNLMKLMSNKMITSGKFHMTDAQTIHTYFKSTRFNSFNTKVFKLARFAQLNMRAYIHNVLTFMYIHTSTHGKSSSSMGSRALLIM